MKRYAVLVVFVVIAVSARYAGTIDTVDNGVAIPSIPPGLEPGSAIPPDAACTSYAPYFQDRYCIMADGNVWIVVVGSKITQTEIFVYYKNIRAGDLITAWGKPERVDFQTPTAVDLYWSNKFAYVFTRDHFNAYSRVGFISYGKRIVPKNKWKGFVQK